MSSIAQSRSGVGPKRTYRQMKTQVLAVLLTILLLSPAVSEDAPMSVKPALNEPVSPVSAGTRPYEMEGRKEDRVPLVDFEDLTG